MTVVSADGRYSFDREELSSAGIAQRGGKHLVTARTQDGGPYLMGVYRTREGARAALNDMATAAGESYRFPSREEEA